MVVRHGSRMENKIPRNIQLMFSDVRLEYARCPLGCTVDDKTVLTGTDRLYNLPGVFTVVRCKHCGLMRTHPRPTEDTISFYYPNNYGPYLSTEIDVNRKSAMADPFLKKAIKNVFQFNTGRMPNIPPGRMLEIGCASGSFLAYMSDRGWDVDGIELSATAAENARKIGFSVYSGPTSSAPEPTVPYDLIVGWMVFEHLHQPLRELTRLRRWLHDKGTLVLSMPNAGSPQFKLFQSAWHDIHLPAHLFHYTPATLKMVLNRSGWQIIKIHPQRILSNLFKSMANRIGDSNDHSVLAGWLATFPDRGWKHHYLLYPLGYLLGLLGQTGRMTIWAKKK